MAEGINLLLAVNSAKTVKKLRDQLHQTSLQIHSVLNVESLEKVIDFPEKQNVDMLLIDVECALPDISKNLRSIQEQYPDKPLLVLIDINEFDSSRQAIVQGTHGFISKSEIISSMLECVILQAMDRVNTRVQLHESVDQLANLLDNLPGFAYQCNNDKDWTMKFISSGCRQITGYEPQELLHNNKLSYNDLIHPDDQQMVNQDVQKAISENRRFQLEYRILTADNHEKWVWEQGIMTKNSLGEQILEGFITDITDRRQRELNLRHLKEVGDLLHDPSVQFEFGEKVLGRITTLFKLSGAALARINIQNNSLNMEFAQGNWLNQQQTEIPISGLNCSGLVQKKEPTFLFHKYDPEIECDQLLNENSPNLMFLPLNSEDLSGRVLIIGRENAFSENDVQVFTAISDLLSSAISRFDLIQKLEKQLTRLGSLHTIDQAITGVFDIRVINRVILEEVRKGLGADAAVIWHLNSLTNTLDLNGEIGITNSFINTRKLSISTSLAGKSLMSRMVLKAPDLSKSTDEFSIKKWQDEGFKAYFAHPLVVKGKPIGVMELFFRPPFYPDVEWLKFFESLATQAAVAYDSCNTFGDLQRVKQNLANSYNAALETWSRSLELNNIESEGHVQRVTIQTLELAKDLGFDESELPNIERGALLHDIGKLGILDEILLKKGQLSDSEWHEIEKHPSIAKDLLSGVNLLKDAVDIPFSHHENWDGSGYPQGLKGEEIPKAARIFAVVEAFDALLSEKPYRSAWTREKAIEYLNQEKGKKFEPKIVDAFIKLLKR